MKVTDVRLESYRWPRSKPIRNGRYVYPTAGLDVVKIETDEGVTGVGLSGGVQESEGIGGPILEHLKQYVIGRDPFDNESKRVGPEHGAGDSSIAHDVTHVGRRERCDHPSAPAQEKAVGRRSGVGVLPMLGVAPKGPRHRVHHHRDFLPRG